MGLLPGQSLKEATSNALMSTIINMISSYLLNPIEDWIRQQGPAEREQKRLRIKVMEEEHQQSLWDMYPSSP